VVWVASTPSEVTWPRPVYAGDTLSVEADCVILCAGALGSSAILLRFDSDKSEAYKNNVRLLVGVHPAGQTAQRGSTIYFRVADIRAVFRSLSEKKVEFMAEPHIVHRTPNSELWLAEFTDPDGNRLALMSQTSSLAS
jgi:hypothetical protein